MIGKEMIKKHLLTCSVTLVLVLISELNIFGTTIIEKTAKAATLSPRTSDFIFLKSTKAVAYNFANEALPVNDARVTRKLKTWASKVKLKFMVPGYII
jgi:membrane-bound lytic murein transglycosylase D